jgi:chemotaxis protein histidine kinase CheA
MISPKLIAGTTLSAVLLLPVAAPSLARDLYRYINEEGNVVVDYQVPAELVDQGYEILNPDGTVREIVPRQLTPEERRTLTAEQREAKRLADEKERLRAWDESLLLRYSSVEDIEAARERSLRVLQIRLSILKSNTRALKQQVENHQAKAADIERSGSEVPVEILENIDNLQDEIVYTDRAIAERKLELEEVSQAFQRDIERFQLLLDLVELRRNYSGTNTTTN